MLKYKKYIQAAVLLLIIALVMIVLIFYRPVTLGGNTYYEPVYTGSMEPTIPVGGIVIIQTIDPSTVQVGDIICFKGSETTTITHRVISKTDGGFITKGDANEDQDVQPVAPQSIVGKVTGIIPLVGYLGFFVRTPLGFVVLIIVPASALILLEVKNLWKNSKKTAPKS